MLAENVLQPPIRTSAPDGPVPVEEIPGINTRTARLLKQADIHCLTDLLFWLPLTYQDRTRLTPIADLKLHAAALVQGQVIRAVVSYGRKRILSVELQDKNAKLWLRFFHFNLRQQATFKPTTLLRCYGITRPGSSGLQMIHPQYELLAAEKNSPLAVHYTAHYPDAQGISAKSLAQAVDKALSFVHSQSRVLPDLLPEKIRNQYHFPTLHHALRAIHQPGPEISLAQLNSGHHPAQRRLVFEELLAHHLSLRQLRQHIKQCLGPQCPAESVLLPRFTANLPFKLTSAQTRVMAEIKRDLTGTSPMLRLLQGDVGSGKTVVAAWAALGVIEAGYQVALMAPTELLAEQHCTTFQQWFAPLSINLVYLSGQLKKSQRDAALSTIARGDAAMVLGTHALFQHAVGFQRLGLVIVDEQHRFGVKQRLDLFNKGVNQNFQPHQLIMSATPIPRSLAMTVHADLDCSIMDELPPGRLPVKTLVVSQDKRAAVVKHTATACANGAQVYWVCTLIQESEELQCQAAQTTAVQLQQALPSLRIGLIHGKMKSADKEHAMKAFKQAQSDILVATTVIEVGVDVPKATLMVIENAERLGLAQLHQLRGRVGRDVQASTCILMYQGPLSDLAKSRLEILRHHHDGFAIAQRDLEMRGAGELLGKRQTGAWPLKIAQLARDADLLPAVQAAAQELLTEKNPASAALIQRWLGNSHTYAQV